MIETIPPSYRLNLIYNNYIFSDDSDENDCGSTIKNYKPWLLNNIVFSTRLDMGLGMGICVRVWYKSENQTGCDDGFVDRVGAGDGVEDGDRDGAANRIWSRTGNRME